MADELVLDIKTNIGSVTEKTKEYKKSLEDVNEQINLQTRFIIAQEKELIKLKDKQDAIPKGGWVAGMDKLNDKIRETTAELNDEKNGLKLLKQEQKEATQEVKKHKDAQKENNKESEDTIGNLKIMGVSLNGIKKGFNKLIPAAKAMFGTIKAGIMSTGIGALVIAVIALMQSFKRSEAGQEKFQRIMAGIGAVTNQVLDLFADLGETIIEAVTSPMKALESLGNGIIDFFKDPIGAAKNLVNTVDKFVEKTKEEIDAIDEVTKARQKAHHIDRELKVERAKADREINDIRLQAEDREKFNARERIDLLRKAQAIEEGISDKQIESKKILIDAQIKEMELGKNTIEDKDKLAQLQAEAIDLDTKRLRSQRLLQTQITTALNEEKAARTDMTKLFVDQIDERIDAINKLAKADNKALDNYLKSSDKRKQTDKEVADAKTNITKDGFRLAQGLAKEGTALSKAIAIAEVTASGVEGVQSAFTTAQKSPYTLINPAYPFIQAGLSGAFSAVQLAKIISGSSAEGGGGGGGGASAATQTPAPQMMSGAFDLSGGVAPDPVQAFVVTDAMTNSQNQLANIRRRATI
tara:strand:- start:285 stop:2030 length:1746 start_codon:yes stop_codon:yes gene_type:complete